MTKYIAATLLTLVTAGICAGQSQPDSLGEVARRNHHGKKAVLVVTEDNISSVGGTISVVGSEQVQSSNTSASAPKKAAENTPAAPSANAAGVAELKTKLDSAKQELDGWKQGEALSRPVGYRRRRIPAPDLSDRSGK